MEALPNLPVRKNLPHDIPSWVPDGEIFFITICAAHREAQPLANPKIAQAFLQNPVRKGLVKEAEEWPWLLRQRDLGGQNRGRRVEDAPPYPKHGQTSAYNSALE